MGGGPVRAKQILTFAECRVHVKPTRGIEKGKSSAVAQGRPPLKMAAKART